MAKNEVKMNEIIEACDNNNTAIFKKISGNDNAISLLGSCVVDSVSGVDSYVRYLFQSLALLMLCVGYDSVKYTTTIQTAFNVDSLNTLKTTGKKTAYIYSVFVRSIMKLLEDNKELRQDLTTKLFIGEVGYTELMKYFYDKDFMKLYENNKAKLTSLEDLRDSKKKVDSAKTPQEKTPKKKVVIHTQDKKVLRATLLKNVTNVFMLHFTKKETELTEKQRQAITDIVNDLIGGKMVNDYTTKLQM